MDPTLPVIIQTLSAAFPVALAAQKDHELHADLARYNSKLDVHHKAHATDGRVELQNEVMAAVLRHIPHHLFAIPGRSKKLTDFCVSRLESWAVQLNGADSDQYSLSAYIGQKKQEMWINFVGWRHSWSCPSSSRSIFADITSSDNASGRALTPATTSTVQTTPLPFKPEALLAVLATESYLKKNNDAIEENFCVQLVRARRWYMSAVFEDGSLLKEIDEFCKTAVVGLKDEAERLASAMWWCSALAQEKA
ncbi:hypothetical protein MIND_01182100 [Mycena indigotica]|uniref:Uncharacterized protein n=1 Tax=Mycena indigotica TaxID=2126181 RepID=A0A8H6VUW2_9AGAR|nr:uncharacterized protein MIND_01182100 [Mycena indigotica]KAF7292831.1 hypothetical protein MIND_01182100 [Mycena indigotica]